MHVISMSTVSHIVFSRLRLSPIHRVEQKKREIGLYVSEKGGSILYTVAVAFAKC